MSGLNIIQGVTISLPVIGRVMIGHIEMKKIEGVMKPVPKKDDFFTVTTNVQKDDRTWEPHPVRARLGDAKQKGDASQKLTEIPIRIAYNDLRLNLSSNYSAFDPQKGRILCTGNGCKAKRITSEGVKEIDCPRPEACEFAQRTRCRSMVRFYFKIDGQDNELGLFVLRSTGWNSLSRLAAHLAQLSGAMDGKIAGLPLKMVVRGKSTQQSMRKPIYHVDLELPNGVSLIQAAATARSFQDELTQAGLKIENMERALLEGLANGDLADELEDADEWVSEPETDEDFLNAAVASVARHGLKGLDAIVKQATGGTGGDAPAAAPESSPEAALAA